MRYWTLAVFLFFLITHPLSSINLSDTSALSLEDIRENPGEYLGERVAHFTVVNVSLRLDPSNRLIEKYYLVHIQDSSRFGVSYVISEEKYQKYIDFIGKNATFNLVGNVGPGLVHPPDRLITNILASKSRDPYSMEKVYIFIFIEGELDEDEINEPPDASFTFSPASPKVRDEVQFTDTSTDVDGHIASWYWEFGDGGTSSEKNPAHKYSAKGAYATILTVTDDKGADANSTQTITLKPSPVLERSTMWVVLGALAIISVIVITVIQRR